MFRLFEKYALRDLVNFISQELEKARYEAIKDTHRMDAEEVADHIAKAREEGRQEGFAEGLKGNDIIKNEAYRDAERTRILGIIDDLQAASDETLAVAVEKTGEPVDLISWNQALSELKERIK